MAINVSRDSYPKTSAKLPSHPLAIPVELSQPGSDLHTRPDLNH
jgi:hypothetical protein